MVKVTDEMVDAADARIAELEAALMPFAEQAERYDPDEGDDLQSAWDSGGITIGDLRRARAVLNPGDQK